MFEAEAAQMRRSVIVAMGESLQHQIRVNISQLFHNFHYIHSTKFIDLVLKETELSSGRVCCGPEEAGKHFIGVLLCHDALFLRVYARSARAL